MCTECNSLKYYDTLRIIIDLHVILFYVFVAARKNKFVSKKNVRS
jgi:hypothetical protein